ncbi:MAG: 50S ribosomal protein L5 [Porphyromonadaceae bacterium]|nr:MAG: 50S ribosomal protein L5 [Porphyromonadaceae bacterium]
MKYTPSLKVKYQEEIIPALTKEFDYKTVMQVPRLEKIVVNRGVGKAVADKKLIEVAQEELTAITGQKAVQTLSKRDISNFKLRQKMPIGVKVTLRREKMYEFLERLIAVALPRIRDFNGVGAKFDGRGNYTLGITEQIIFPEIEIDKIHSMIGMEISFVTTAKTDEEGLALLKEFGIPFKSTNKK